MKIPGGILGGLKHQKMPWKADVERNTPTKFGRVLSSVRKALYGRSWLLKEL